VPYLRPYSPDLNPIEHHWAWSKNKLSYFWRHVANFYDRLSLARNLNMEYFRLVQYGREKSFYESESAFPLLMGN
jgi:transposase